MSKVYVIVENFRNEKCGDSTENISVVCVKSSQESAQEKVKELHEHAMDYAKQYFDEEDIAESIGPHGSECELEFEYDTFHYDYYIEEKEIED